MPIPPPPPPPGLPPPPDPGNFKLNIGGGGNSNSSGDGKGRNMLLDAIRQGKTLKKTTVLNDRSSPIVDSKSKSNSGGSSGSSSSGNIGTKTNGVNAPPGLAGLFSGGMPKLKPVGQGQPGSGSPRNIPRNASSNSLGNTNTSDSINSLHISTSPSICKPQPPQPPPANLKPSIPTTTTTPQQPHVTPTMSIEDKERRISHGKPSLAPKPPALNGVKPTRPNPPPKFPNLYIPPPPPPMTTTTTPPQSASTPSTPPPGVNRAQSMRIPPKSASPTSHQAASLEYRTMGRAAGRSIATSQGQGQGQTQPPPPPRILTNSGGRPRPSPLRPPSARPPPPPNKAPPVHPPPPPPMIGSGPPPPPHRTVPPPPPPILRLNGNLGPLPSLPTVLGGGSGGGGNILGPSPGSGCPPPPPTRNSSMRSINSSVSMTSVGHNSSGSSTSSSSILYHGVDLESKFHHLFHSIDELPGPEPYTGMVKTYPSKSAQSVKRQPAPPPPTTQVQLGAKLWVNNTSTC